MSYTEKEIIKNGLTFIERYDENNVKYAEYLKPVEETIEPQPEPEPQPTQFDRIEDNELIIMEALAEQYEESVEKDLMNMEVQATIYESILALGGEV